MKKSLLVLVLLFSSVACVVAQGISIVPQPVNVTETDEGDFTLGAKNVIYVDTKSEESQVAQMFSLNAGRIFGKPLVIKDKKELGKSNVKNAIVFVRVSDKVLGAEGYEMKIEKQQVVIQANERAGFFYALQTLYQLLSPDFVAGEVKAQPRRTFKLPACEIIDYPRFAYRGKHFDSARHFFTLDQVKRHIDLMAFHKLNTLHFHLTDDQGWRVEIKRYPRLQTVASRRKGTIIGHYNDNDQRNPNYDGIPHGGYYTQEELKELVAYAKQRCITIVPEIEIPGHASAALAAYPELGCKGEGYEVQGTWGVFEEVFCTKDSVLEFFKNVFDEVMDIFPSEYINIGGDECPKTNWKLCPKCQAQMRKHGLKDERELQTWFMNQIELYINSKGRKVIAWDEILEGGKQGNPTVLSWQGESGGVEAARLGLDAIMSPAAYLYFDYYQGEPSCEPLAIGGYTPLRKVYLYEPVPAQLSSEQAKHIIGVQANTWTEYIATYQHLQYMDFPRIAALSEIAWSKKESKDYDGFIDRLEELFAFYDAMNVNYSRSHYAINAEVGFNKNLSEVELNLITAAKNAKIYYSFDTSENKHFALFEHPVAIKHNAGLTAYVERAGKQISPLFTATYLLNKATGKPYTIANVNPQYMGSTTNALTDGLVGSARSYDKWVGTYGYDYEVVLDLERLEDVSRISINFLDNRGSWIFLPLGVDFYLSSDKENWEKISESDIHISQNGQIQTRTAEFKTKKARYVKIFATSQKQCPKGHPGYGYPAHCFADEIIVQ